MFSSKIISGRSYVQVCPCPDRDPWSNWKQCFIRPCQAVETSEAVLVKIPLSPRTSGTPCPLINFSGRDWRPGNRCLLPKRKAASSGPRDEATQASNYTLLYGSSRSRLQVSHAGASLWNRRTIASPARLTPRPCQKMPSACTTLALAAAARERDFPASS